MTVNQHLRTAALLSVALFALAAPSCGKGPKPVYPVRGKVVDGNQRPAVGATVILHPVEEDDPEQPKPVGTVDDNGEFTLMTYKRGDGAPAGEYFVTLIWVPARKSLADPEPTDLLGGRYALPKESPVPKFKVEPTGSNEVPTIQLK